MDEDIKFIDWLKSRLIYKHNYSRDDFIIKYLENISHRLLGSTNFRISLDDDDWDRILSKYYADFHLDKSDNADGLSLGYTDQERNHLRKNIKNLVSDVINRKIPQDFLIKDK